MKEYTEARSERKKTHVSREIQEPKSCEEMEAPVTFRHFIIIRLNGEISIAI